MAERAEVYIGSRKCGTLPREIEKNEVLKVYCGNAGTVGSYVRIRTGRNGREENCKKATFTEKDKLTYDGAP